MKLGMVGLGRMGGNMSLRLHRAGHEVVGFARGEDDRARVAAEGVQTASSLEEMVDLLDDPPKVVWLMIPAGAPTDDTVTTLGDLLTEGDVVIDGGNSNFRDSQRHHAFLGERGVAFLDCGTSGGIWGLAVGYCLMVGGDRAAFDAVEPVLAALAPQDGYAYVGDSGAGHFTKMVHNGIEYGLLAAYGEGMEILRASEFHLDLTAITGIWRYGSVVRSWLLDLLHDALEKDPDLATVEGYVEDSGEGRWTVQAAIDQDVPAPITTLALFQRFASRQ
jgi:6-phosphogluconate dehydrogenase